MIEEEESFEFINSIEDFIKQKWFCEIQYSIKGHKFEQRTLIDSGADVNCIRERLIPSRFLEKSTHKVHTANGGELRTDYKIPEMQVCVGKTRLATSFLLVENLRQEVILRTPFFSLIKPFTVSEEEITTHLEGKRVKLRLCSKPEESFLNQLRKAIDYRKRFINKLFYSRIGKLLSHPQLREEVIALEQQFKENSCSKLPVAF